MITSITFQFTYNKNYLAVVSTPKVYGERSLTDLETSLADDIDFLEKTRKLVAHLNANLFVSDVIGVIKQYFRMAQVAANCKTKTKRSYSFAGITIYQEDNTTLDIRRNRIIYENFLQENGLDNDKPSDKDVAEFIAQQIEEDDLTRLSEEANEEIKEFLNQR